MNKTFTSAIAATIIAGSVVGSPTDTSVTSNPFRVAEAIHTPTHRAGRAGARDFARSLLVLRGYGSGQYQCLQRLWHRESRWNPNAYNKRTGAYGIPQRIHGKGKKHMSDYRGQIVWGLDYITTRYGSPCDALRHQLLRGWY